MKNTNLYRIISLPSFINIIETKNERYVCPFCWEDTHEGYLLKDMEKFKNDPGLLKKYLVEMYDNLAEGDPEVKYYKIVEVFYRFYCARWIAYGQCWSKTPESDALWRIYSYGKQAVRVETDSRTIEKIIKRHRKCLVNIETVKYDQDDLENIQKQLLQTRNTKRTAETYYHKRKAFKHENEVRVIVFDQDNNPMYTFIGLCKEMVFHYLKQELLVKVDVYNSESIILEKLAEKMAESLPEYKDSQKMSSLNINLDDTEISEYIKGVMVHPQAEDWIVNLVRTICERKKISFLGKSQLYD